MTYTEIDERYWHLGAAHERPEFLQSLPSGERMAWEVLEFFDRRKGFDQWWNGIDEDSKNQLFNDLAKVMAKHSKSKKPWAEFSLSIGK